PLQLLYRCFDVQLTRTGEEELFGLCVARVAQGLILFEHLGESRREFVFVLSRFGRYGEVDGRLREMDRIKIDRCSFIGERIAGRSLLQFGDGNYIAGMSLGDLLHLVALKNVERAESFLRALRYIEDRSVGFEDAGIDLEEGDTAKLLDDR